MLYKWMELGKYLMVKYNDGIVRRRRTGSSSGLPAD